MTARRMRIACWISKATNIHSEYVKLLLFRSKRVTRTRLNVTCAHYLSSCRGQLKCDGTRAETRFGLSAKRTSPFKSAEGRQFSRLLAAEVCASAVVMLDTPCSEVVWRVLATHCISQFPLYFPSRASPCAITFQLESTSVTWILFAKCFLITVVMNSRLNLKKLWILLLT